MSRNFVYALIIMINDRRDVRKIRSCFQIEMQTIEITFIFPLLVDARVAFLREHTVFSVFFPQDCGRIDPAGRFRVCPSDEEYPANSGYYSRVV